MSLAASGSTATLSAAGSNASQSAANGIDGCMNPYDGPACAPVVSHGNDVVFPGDIWEVTFGGGIAAAKSTIATVYYVNRMDAGYATSITLGGGVFVSLFAPNGAAQIKTLSSSATVSTLSFAASSAPVAVDPTSAVQTVNAQLKARYVTVSAVPGGIQCLTFNELFVVDDTFTNVALNKSTTCVAPAINTTCGNGNDGVINMDATTTSSLVYSGNCDGTDSWTVDLGGVFNITSLIMWNRHSSTDASAGAALAGATASFYNAAQSYLGSVTFSGAAVQTIPVALSPPTPSNTGSSSATASPSQTPSTSATPTNTLSQGALSIPAPSLAGTSYMVCLL